MTTTGTEPGAGFLLRGEARVLSWGELTDEQKQAGNQVHGLLAQMVNSNEQLGKTENFLPRIDQERKNHVVLIDGGRGSGKTALLVTLIDLWRRLGAKVGDKRDDWIVDRIVPIGLLDLHPLPASTNLLLHVAGRFQHVVEWLEGTAKPDGTVPWDGVIADEVPARRHWRDLLRAVATGWDGGTEQRLARLDLEAYTTELEETERRRLDLQTKFHDLLEALVAGYKTKRPMQDPLFLLAIDDADMNPRRSAELLDMLRMLWHPRLAFVLTGDSRLFRQTLREHILAELRHPHLGHLRDMEITEVVPGRQVMRLADEIYEKVIPPGHRSELRPVAPAKRLDVVVHRFERDGKQGFTTVRGAFAGLAIEPMKPGAAPFLAGYFEADAQQLGRALPDRLRSLIDLADEARVLKEHNAEPPSAVASRVVTRIWQNVLRQHPELEGYDDVVQVDETSGALEIEMPARAPALKSPRVRDIKAVAPTAAPSAADQQAPPPMPSPLVNLHWLSRLDAPLVDTRPLPAEVVAALTLAAAVASDQAESRMTGEPSGLTGFEALFASADLPLPGGAP